MKFITRELHQGGQGLPDEESDSFELRWHRACDSYREQLKNIHPALPPGMQALADITLHDGVVHAMTRPDPGTLIFTIDATGNPWGPVGWFTVKFTGIHELEISRDLIGDEWLYEEVHLHPVGRFEYRILFWKTDFRIVADEVELSPHPGLTK